MTDENARWEYRTLHIGAPFNQYSIVDLEASGKEGWELVHLNAGNVALLRRRVVADEN